MKEKGETILTPRVSLDTPGKATVEVVILADPVSTRIQFVEFPNFQLGDHHYSSGRQVFPVELVRFAIENTP